MEVSKILALDRVLAMMVFALHGEVIKIEDVDGDKTPHFTHIELQDKWHYKILVSEYVITISMVEGPMCLTYLFKIIFNLPDSITSLSEVIVELSHMTPLSNTGDLLSVCLNDYLSHMYSGQISITIIPSSTPRFMVSVDRELKQLRFTTLEQTIVLELETLDDVIGILPNVEIHEYALQNLTDTTSVFILLLQKVFNMLKRSLKSR